MAFSSCYNKTTNSTLTAQGRSQLEKVGNFIFKKLFLPASNRTVASNIQIHWILYKFKNVLPSPVLTNFKKPSLPDCTPW